MTPFEAYKLYVAIRNHFRQKSYDYFKYKGALSFTIAAYHKRSDKRLFEKLAERPDALQYLVANFVSNDSFWLGDTDTLEKNYRVRKKIWDAQTHFFTTDIKKIARPIKELIAIKDGMPPIILLYLNQEISLETLTIFTDVVGCYSYWNKELKHDIIWDHVGLKLKKYKPFLSYDKKKYLDIVKKHCISSSEPL